MEKLNGALRRIPFLVVTGMVLGTGLGTCTHLHGQEDRKTDESVRIGPVRLPDLDPHLEELLRDGEWIDIGGGGDGSLWMGQPTVEHEETREVFRCVEVQDQYGPYESCSYVFETYYGRKYNPVLVSEDGQYRRYFDRYVLEFTWAGTLDYAGTPLHVLLISAVDRLEYDGRTFVQPKIDFRGELVVHSAGGLFQQDSMTVNIEDGEGAGILLYQDIVEVNYEPDHGP